MIIQWIINCLFWTGAGIYSSKKASKNNLYIAIGLMIFTIGGIIYVFFCLFNNLIEFAIGQIPFIVLDTKGTIYNLKMWKKCQK